MDLTVLKKKFAEWPEACHCADVAVFSSMVDVIDIALGRFFTLFAGNLISNDALRRTANQFELQMKYDHLVAQLGNVTSKCGIWHSLARERGDDIINLQPFVNSIKDERKLLESQAGVLRKGEEADAFQRDA